MKQQEKKFKRHVLFAIQAYKERLDAHCANGNSAQKMSEQCGISRNLLQQGFKELFGLGIRDYKLKQRMERSRQLLKEGKDVREVARILHYTKPRAFSTAFKRYYGLNPTHFAPSIARAIKTKR
jgi:AraC-like DNA-binding protein